MDAFEIQISHTAEQQYHMDTGYIILKNRYCSKHTKVNPPWSLQYILLVERIKFCGYNNKLGSLICYALYQFTTTLKLLSCRVTHLNFSFLAHAKYFLVNSKQLAKMAKN